MTHKYLQEKIEEEMIELITCKLLSPLGAVFGQITVPTDLYLLEAQHLLGIKSTALTVAALWFPHTCLQDSPPVSVSLMSKQICTRM